MYEKIKMYSHAMASSTWIEVLLVEKKKKRKTHAWCNNDERNIKNNECDNNFKEKTFV